MSQQLAAVIEAALTSGADDAEAYAEESVSRRLKVFRGDVEQLVQASRRGIGLRVVRGASMGAAYTSDLSPSGVRSLVTRAVEHAGATDPDDHARLAEPAGTPAAVSVYDAGVATYPLESKIALAMQAEQAALDSDSRVKLVEDTVYADGEATVSLLSSRGINAAYRESHSYLFLYAIAEEGDAVETGISYSVHRDPAALQPRACGVEAAQRACRLLGARPCDGFKGTAVLEPFVAAAVLTVLGSALTAESVQKGRSLFAPLQDTPVAAEMVSLVDDGVHPDGLASAPFDGEGTPCQRTVLIGDGVLRGFLYDVRTGLKQGCASTGNGVRSSYQSTPTVSPTNLVLEGKGLPVDEIVAGVERGVLVTDAVGVHSGANPVSGEFSVGISGILIEHGRLTRPLREMTLAGDLLGMLRGIVALGDDARWVPSGSVLVPTVAIRDMSFAGS